MANQARAAQTIRRGGARPKFITEPIGCSALGLNTERVRSKIWEIPLSIRTSRFLLWTRSACASPLGKTERRTFELQIFKRTRLL